MAPLSKLRSPVRPTFSSPKVSRASIRTRWQSSVVKVWCSAPQRPRLLIVDDDRSLLSLLSVIFGAAGFDVATAADGAEALDAVTKDQPEAILLDLEMPGMNGRDLFRHLRGAGIDVPVLILSAYNARSAQLELGAEAYTAKPFDPDDLVQSVRSLLASSPSSHR